MKEIRQPKAAISWVTEDGYDLEKSVITLRPGIKQATAKSLRKMAEKWRDNRQARQNFKRALRQGKVMTRE